MPGAPGGRHARRRPVVLVALWMAIVVAVAAVAVVWRGTDRYYAYSPGTAPQIVSDPTCRTARSATEPALPNGTPCANLTVPKDKAHALNGRLFMVDVLVGPANAEQYVLDRLGLLSRFMAGTQLVPAAEVLGPTPADQLTCENGQQMTSATESASVAALRRVGYRVKENDLGAQVDTVSTGTPAAAAGMACNDVITAIDSRPVRSVTDLHRILVDTRPGQTARVSVQRTGAGGRRFGRTLNVRLGSTPAEAGDPAMPSRSFLGIVTESRVTYDLPFKVRVDVGDIGGPSAGLALTLGLLDLLTNGNLTGGHRVAATGTMDASGNVGDVGGVAQKTVAVEQAGAQLFLVPSAELAVAAHGAGCHGPGVSTDGPITGRPICPRMKVEAVTTLSQALAELAAFNGHRGSLADRPEHHPTVHPRVVR